ncbi:PAS domain-containing protein [Inhella sp. 4Y17]|uniref:histidine kinase n=2 Tax=Inhella gelatinilytica TaxID=2795030 RepID=A0A931NDM0_9BURK|nr:PAS domain-containing protein [Inhella gelatinilytica]
MTWGAPLDHDSGLDSRWDVRPEPNDPEGAFRRLFTTFMAARAALGCVLLLAVLSGVWLNRGLPPAVIATCGLYAVWVLWVALWPPLREGVASSALRSLRSRHWWGSIGADVVAFTVLQPAFAEGGLPVAALYVLPILSAGVLSTRRLAVGTAAMATLGLLGGLLWADLAGRDNAQSFLQAGLAGSGYFAVSLLASEMAQRLAREQRSARGSLALARQQAALNQLVIDEMQEGVLVLDAHWRVLAANPAARALLGEVDPAPAPPFELTAKPAWQGLVEAAQDTFEGSFAARDVALNFAQAPPRALRVRGRLSASAEGGSSCVLLLEDRATLMARMRQERMAAMGRMSAGVAHEIRNPLAAISQANALLAEDLADPGAQRLTGLVSANVARLKRIVDDVMVLAAAPDATVPVLDLGNLAAEVAQEWAQTQGLTVGVSLRLTRPDQPVKGRFDSEHWRRVLVNLLDNAWRHAQEAALDGQGRAGAWIGLAVEPVSAGGAARIRVFNPGPPIRPEVERYLFEPFYSTRSRGSGLGLHICRELCERYGAAIRYQAAVWQGVAGNAFDVVLPPDNATP